MAGTEGRRGLRKPHPRSSGRSSEAQGQGVEDRSMAPEDLSYELARHRIQSLGDKEDTALELCEKANESIGIQAQPQLNQGPPSERKWRTEKASEVEELVFYHWTSLKVYSASPLTEIGKHGEEICRKAPHKGHDHTNKFLLAFS